MSVKSLMSLVVALFGLTAFSVDGCGDPSPAPPNLFSSIGDANAFYAKNSFSSSQLSTTCILASCPSLKGMCPLSSQAALSNAVSTFCQCLSKNAPICGIDMSRIPMSVFGWTTGDVIPSSAASGTCWVQDQNSFLTNLPSAIFTVNPEYNSNGLINLCIDVTNLVNSVSYNCSFQLPSLISLNVPNVRSVFNLNASSTYAFNITTPIPTFTPLVNQHNLKIVFSNFLNSQGQALDPSLVNLLNQGMNTQLNNNVIPMAEQNFLATYAALSLQAAQLNC